MYKSLWPLPGGTRKYNESLIKILEFVDKEKPTRDELIDWIIENFPRVESRKTTDGYIDVVICLKFIEIDKETGICKLTPLGKELLRTKDNSLIFKALIENILAVKEIVEIIGEKQPVDKQAIKQAVVEKFHFNWEGDSQINWRLYWLLSTGIIRESGGLYSLTDIGLREKERLDEYQVNIDEYTVDLEVKEVAEKENAVEPKNPEYPLIQCSKDLGIPEETINCWINAILRKGQAIIYGPPGTGKTFTAELLADHLISGGDGFKDLVQFHPAYTYEDFIQGIRPQTNKEGVIEYNLVPGRFLEFCNKASSRKGHCVLIIDEINRANIARVFGELMYLLEYRDREIPLAAGGTLRIPSNVIIIGTMNTADRSIALVDYALRRRFAFIPLYPNYEILRKYHHDTRFPVEKLIGVLNEVNNKIGDKNFMLGVSFFLRKDLAFTLRDIWKMEIEPYLEEFFFDRPEKVDEFRWEKIEGKIINEY